AGVGRRVVAAVAEHDGAVGDRYPQFPAFVLVIGEDGGHGLSLMDVKSSHLVASRMPFGLRGRIREANGCVPCPFAQMTRRSLGQPFTLAYLQFEQWTGRLSGSHASIHSCRPGGVTSSRVTVTWHPPEWERLSPSGQRGRWREGAPARSFR